MQKELDIRQLISILRKRIWLIVLLGIACMALAFTASKYMLRPLYSAKVSLYVTNPRSQATTASINDLTIAQKLVNTYIVILKSDVVLSNVASKVNLGYNAQQIRKMIKANAVNNTEVFEVSIINDNPQHAALIANTIADSAPSEIIRVVKAGSVEVIDYAKTPNKPVSPNVLNNTVIGFLLGIILAVGISLLIELIDTSINDESDLVENYNFPVLGVIPTLVKANGKKGEKK